MSQAEPGEVVAPARQDRELLYERAPCGYLSATLEGTITDVNETFLEMVGLARDDLVGRRRFVDLLTAGGRIYHETHISPVLHGAGRIQEVALELVRGAGPSLPVLVNGVLDREPAGAPPGIRFAVFDASSRRSYEREVLAAKERAEASEAAAVALARTLQQTLIPPSPPTVAGLDVAAAYRPAGDGSEVGGDFYDVFEAEVDEWVFAVGDVSGKGVPAAVVTATTRRSLRESALRNASPAAMLAVLNAAVLASPTDRYCTAAVLRLAQDDGRWPGRVAVGGHPFPLLVRDGEVAPVATAGSLVGALDSVTFTDCPVELRADDVVVLFTDGVTEARRGSDFYGDERLAHLLARRWASAAELVDAVMADVMAFQGAWARDDVVVMAVRVS